MSTDLSNLIGAEAKPQEASAPAVDAESTEGDIAAQILEHIEKISASLAANQMMVRMLASRLVGLEQHVDYLLQQDPVVGPKIKAEIEKQAKDAKEANPGQ